MTSKINPLATPPRPYRSAGEWYLATAIPGLFNLTVGFLRLTEFVRFQEAYESNARCREHWPQLTRYVHRADPQLFSVFRSKAALRWVLFKGINARGWELYLFPLKNCTYRSFNQLCHDGDLDTVRAMVERTYKGIACSSDGYGCTPLHFAACNENNSVVQYLCEQGVDKEARDSSGWTPLHWAADMGHLAVVQCLCEQGADQEARDSYSRTPLLQATWSGHLPVVQYLLEHGANREARSTGGMSPLTYAAELGHLSLVKYLCEYGADKEAGNNYNRTALHHAAESGQLSVVEYLCSQEANKEARDNHGETPLNLARSSAVRKCLGEERQ
jgi:ankyrin repeat protein